MTLVHTAPVRIVAGPLGAIGEAVASGGNRSELSSRHNPSILRERTRTRQKDCLWGQRNSQFSFLRYEKRQGLRYSLWLCRNDLDNSDLRALVVLFRVGLSKEEAIKSREG